MIQLILTIIDIIVLAYSVYKLATVDMKGDKHEVIYLFPIYICLMVLILIWL